MEMWLLPWRPNLLFTGRTFYKVVTREGGEGFACVCVGGVAEEGGGGRGGRGGEGRGDLLGL